MVVIADSSIPFVEEAFADFGEVRTMPGRDITSQQLKEATILLVRSITTVDKNLLEGTGVKFVATATIGTDHIDTAYLAENNIGFAYAPGSNAESVAEYITAALFELTQARGRKLNELALGIVGCGNIGSRVFRHAQALGMHCLLNDPPKKRISGSISYLPLEKVLRESDIVSLHVPLNMHGSDATYHMVNNGFLLEMKKGAILINTSRGRVVDEKVLRANRNRLDSVVLDVWENEPNINVETLKAVDIATPHIAGYSYDGKVRGTAMIYEAACAFFFKKPVWNMQQTLTKEKTQTIDLQDSNDRIADAVLQAYPIMRDDKELRSLGGQAEKKRGAYFDTLRQNYSKRLEFYHYRITGVPKESPDYKILSALGFVFDE